MTAAHTLVVERNEPEDPNFDIDDVNYSLECPGIADGGCEAFYECRDCAKRAAEDEAFEEQLHQDGEAHGKQHQWLMGTWMAESGHCLDQTHDYLDDAARDITKVPGRYPVTVEFEDHGEFMTLHRVELDPA